jgi:hypothetical protein
MIQRLQACTVQSHTPKTAYHVHVYVAALPSRSKAHSAMSRLRAYHTPSYRGAFFPQCSGGVSHPFERVKSHLKSLPSTALPEAIAPGHPCGAPLPHAETLVQTALRLAVGRSGGAAAARWGCRKRRGQGGVAGGGRWGGGGRRGGVKSGFAFPIRTPSFQAHALLQSLTEAYYRPFLRRLLPTQQ